MVASNRFRPSAAHRSAHSGDRRHHHHLLGAVTGPCGRGPDPAYKLSPEVEPRGIPTTVASDTPLRASKDYGALGKSMHPGIKPGHSFILVDQTGTITWRWDWTED